MKSFTQFNTLLSESTRLLMEKLLVIGNGANYGQVVFLAGGAGSGKGFATENFMEKTKFKVRDVDEWKKTFLKIDKLKKKYPEIRGLDLGNPDDVYKLHMFVDKLKIKDKTLSLLLADLKTRDGRRPNIMFDITAKKLKSIEKVIPFLKEAGYKVENIHLVWVLTNFQVAYARNCERERVVPANVFFDTHAGAAKTMQDIIYKEALPRSLLDGGIYVILNNQDETVFWKDGDTVETKAGTKTFKASTNSRAIKDFTYVTLKEPGKPPHNKKEILDMVRDWIAKNAPLSDKDIEKISNCPEESKKKRAESMKKKGGSKKKVSGLVKFLRKHS